MFISLISLFWEIKPPKDQRTQRTQRTHEDQRTHSQPRPAWHALRSAVPRLCSVCFVTVHVQSSSGANVPKCMPGPAGSRTLASASGEAEIRVVCVRVRVYGRELQIKNGCLAN